MPHRIELYLWNSALPDGAFILVERRNQLMYKRSIQNLLALHELQRKEGP